MDTHEFDVVMEIPTLITTYIQKGLEMRELFDILATTYRKHNVPVDLETTNQEKWGDMERAFRDQLLQLPDSTQHHFIEQLHKDFASEFKEIYCQCGFHCSCEGACSKGCACACNRWKCKYCQCHVNTCLCTNKCEPGCHCDCRRDKCTYCDCGWYCPCNRKLSSGPGQTGCDENCICECNGFECGS